MVFLLGWYTITRGPKVTHGFAVYYTNARMLLEGGDFQKAYDFEYFNMKIRQSGISGIEDVPHNPPTNSLLLAPLAWMTPERTKMALSAISFIAILASFYILTRLYRVPLNGAVGMGIGILFLAWRPLYDNIYLGQIYAILLLLFCLSMAGVNRGTPLLASMPLSFAFLVKGHGGIPMLLFAVRKHWKLLLLVVIWIFLVILTTLPFFGIDSWVAFYSRIVAHLGTNPTDAGTSYQTINSLVYHLFTYDERWLPNPLVILPGSLVRIISFLLNLAMIIHVLLAGRASKRSVIPSYSAAIAVGVVTAPLAEEYAFTLFLPLVVAMVTAVVERFRKTSTLEGFDWVCLTAIIVMGAPFPYKSLHYEMFPLILLAYPKLCAGVTILLCFGRMARAGRFDQMIPRA